jgi:general stress protein YciG
VAQTPEEFENQRRHNQPTGKHGGATKGGNEAKPGGNKTNEAPPKGGQTDDGGKYDS